MRTGTLTAIFAALLAMVHGEATIIKRQADLENVNNTDTTWGANPDDIDQSDAGGLNCPPGQKRNCFRGAPPCGDRWDIPGGQVLSDQDIADARKSAQNGDKFPKGQKHPVCQRQYAICIRTPNEAQQAGNGFWEIAKWDGGDGTTLHAVKYWQESMTWNINGGSAKCYLAHGSQWCCAKGVLNWFYEDENYFLRGNSRNRADYTSTREIGGQDWGGPCHCGYKLNSDLELSVS